MRQYSDIQDSSLLHSLGNVASSQKPKPQNQHQKNYTPYYKYSNTTNKPANNRPTSKPATPEWIPINKQSQKQRQQGQSQKPNYFQQKTTSLDSSQYYLYENSGPPSPIEPTPAEEPAQQTLKDEINEGEVERIDPGGALETQIEPEYNENTSAQEPTEPIEASEDGSIAETTNESVESTDNFVNKERQPERPAIPQPRGGFRGQSGIPQFSKPKKKIEAGNMGKKRGDTFVSSHFRVDEETVKQYLTRKRLIHRVTGKVIYMSSKTNSICRRRDCS